MSKFNIPIIWRGWKRQPELPSHLPRLVLADSYQPNYVRNCFVTQRLLPLLKLLEWEQLPTNLTWQSRGERKVPLAAYIGSYLVQIQEGLTTSGRLWRYLRDHPGLVWALGFPLVNEQWDGQFDIDATLPTQRHFNKKLSLIPPEILQTLLDEQVKWLQIRYGESFGQTVALDTKHILAWVRENNPKVYLKEGRFDKHRQPKGDPDCKLGCKRQKNQQTPTKEGEPATKKMSIGEFYWGYASGVVATKLVNVGEFILAETTQTFDHSDISYFFPLMAQVEARLGFRPQYFTADAAFDAFYIHDYFHRSGEKGFAAVPLRQMNEQRQFSEEGAPLCDAKLPLHTIGTFTNRTSKVQHQRGRYRCPLLYPEPNGEQCPVAHPKWEKGGCQLTMPTAIGARLRYQLDRESEQYIAIYNQRTCVERIFSQAVALNIERPKLRNQAAITNRNSLIYLLINLRMMRRIELEGQSTSS